jgi:hypothetical protein
MLRFDGSPGHHDYFLDEIPTPSTTGVIGAAGLYQFDHVPPFILEAARRRGSAVHQLVHFSNEGDLDETSIDPAWRPYLDAWERCRQERAIQILLCEYRVASRRHRVAGTIDLLCTIGDDGWILDYCTGDLADCHKDIQTAGYLGLAFEWAQEDLTLSAVLDRHRRWRRAGVRLLKSGSFRFVEYTDPCDYHTFLTLAAAYHIRRDRGVRLSFEDLEA